MKSSEKHALFEAFLGNLANKPHIIVICEHWLDWYEVKRLYVKGYKTAAWYGRRERQCGGVLILVDKELEHGIQRLTIDSLEMVSEVCGLKLKVNNHELLVIGVYRPPCNLKEDIDSFFKHLENIIETNSAVLGQIILAGDLNINALNETAISTRLMDTMKAYNLTLLNKKNATRSCDKSSTLIDHIFSSINCSHSSYVTRVDFSDHDAVLCDLDIPIEKIKDTYRFSRNYSENNWNDFEQKLMMETWQEIVDLEKTDEKCDLFMRILIEHFECSFPVKKIVIRANQKGKIKLSETTREQQRKLRELGDTIRDCSDAELKLVLKEDFKSLKRYVGFSIDNEKRINNARKIQKADNKSKVSWQIINESIGKSTNSAPIESIEIDSAKVTDKLTIANHLNHQFTVDEPLIQDGSKLGENFIGPDIGDKCFCLTDVTPLEVLKIIRNLPCKDAISWDGMSINVVKRVADLIVLPLCHIINASFTEGCFPKILKTAEVRPLFKKGEKTDAANYRPISITSPISKIFEKAVLNRLENYFEGNDLLMQNQHGFRKKKSTVTALFDLVTEVFNSLEEREKINVILYDFSNAFGTLHPKLLVQKLKCYGLDDPSLAWMSSFLTDRSQSQNCHHR